MEKKKDPPPMKLKKATATSSTKGLLQEPQIEEVCLLVNSLGPIADISAIISTICFRRHNLCKKCQILVILKNTKNHKKPVSFRCTLLLNVQCGISVASMCIFIIFYEKKWLPYIF